MSKIQNLRNRFRAPNGKTKINVGKDPSMDFLLVAKHFVEAGGKPIGYDDIIAGYESFPNLKAYLRAMKHQKMIVASVTDAGKFELTEAGYEWSKSTLGSIRIKPEHWARANARFSKGVVRDFRPKR